MNSAANISLESLNLTEKLVLMERLWEDLSRRPAELPSPDWHGAVLAERAAAIQAGRTSFVPWEEAKQRLRDRLKSMPF